MDCEVSDTTTGAVFPQYALNLIALLGKIWEAAHKVDAARLCCLVRLYFSKESSMKLEDHRKLCHGSGKSKTLHLYLKKKFSS